MGIGCVEPAIPGKTYGWHDSSSFNIARVMQLAINGGRCIDCSSACPRYSQCAGAGKSLSINTGSLETFSPSTRCWSPLTSRWSTGATR